jgi:hypothetical protein
VGKLVGGARWGPGECGADEASRSAATRSYNEWRRRAKEGAATRERGGECY